MGDAKHISVRPITSAQAREAVQRLHYSGKYVNNSQIHVGVFWAGKIEGVIQLGPPMKRINVLTLVAGSDASTMLEINRMAFSSLLPRNSESRALGVVCRLLRKRRPKLEWLLSFSDATQCGDGTIYRASGFVLTQIKENDQLWRLPGGSVFTVMALRSGCAARRELALKHRILDTGQSPVALLRKIRAAKLVGYQLRYIYFLNPEARQRLTVPVLPFSAIGKAGAGMYKGIKRATSIGADAPADQAGEGGSQPTVALHSNAGAI